MSESWITATHPEHGTITGRVDPNGSNGAGYQILMGEHSSAFVNIVTDKWLVKAIIGPIDPATPLGVAIAAFYEDFTEPPGEWADNYSSGYVDLILGIAQKTGVIERDDTGVAAARELVREIIQKNKPKSGETVSD